MTDLAEFLLARIAEDDIIARRSTDLGDLEAAGWYPDRILAECEAQRRIVAEHSRFHHDGRDWCRVCVAPQGFPVAGDPGTPYPCATLRALTLPYADHSDYRPEWA